MKIKLFENNYTIIISKTSTGTEYVITDLTGVPRIPAKGSDLWNLASLIKAYAFCNKEKAEALYQQAKASSWTVPKTTIEDVGFPESTGLMKLRTMAKRQITEQEIIDSVNGIRPFRLEQQYSHEAFIFRTNAYLRRKEKEE